jgi:hypothetical protein
MEISITRIGEEMDEIWWWISFDGLQMDLVDGGYVWRRMALFLEWLPS